MATLSERLHERRGLGKEEALEQDKFGANFSGAQPLPREAYLGGTQSQVLSREEMEGTAPTAIETGKKFREDIGAGLGVVGRGMGAVGRGMKTVQTPVTGFTRGLFGLEQPVTSQGAIQETMPTQTQTPEITPEIERQPSVQPVVPSLEYGAPGQAALTGMSQDEKLWVRQKALTHPNPNIRAWAKNWKDDGVIKEGDTTHVPVFDRTTGMPVINPKTGEMEHISIARHGVKESVQERLEDPRIGIESRKLAAGKERQVAGFGVKQAESLYKAAEALIKAAPESDDPQGNYTQAAHLRGQADQIFKGLTGRGAVSATTGAPETAQRMTQITVETPETELRAYEKWFSEQNKETRARIITQMPPGAQKIFRKHLRK